MPDIDDKVFQYTLDFCQEYDLKIVEADLRENISRHMQSARSVVTDATLERIGHVHLSLIINTAARYDLSLGEVIMEAVRQGSQPVSSLCAAISARKSGTRRVTRKPNLRLV
ncbi:hypothetical protein D9M68_600870 [compost metagenome]